MKEKLMWHQTFIQRAVGFLSLENCRKKRILTLSRESPAKKFSTSRVLLPPLHIKHYLYDAFFKPASRNGFRWLLKEELEAIFVSPDIRRIMGNQKFNTIMMMNGWSLKG